jgi:hypothetical protein
MLQVLYQEGNPATPGPYVILRRWSDAQFSDVILEAGVSVGLRNGQPVTRAGSEFQRLETDRSDAELIRLAINRFDALCGAQPPEVAQSAAIKDAVTTTERSEPPVLTMTEYIALLDEMLADLAVEQKGARNAPAYAAVLRKKTPEEKEAILRDAGKPVPPRPSNPGAALNQLIAELLDLGAEISEIDDQLARLCDGVTDPDQMDAEQVAKAKFSLTRLKSEMLHTS